MRDINAEVAKVTGNVQMLAKGLCQKLLMTVDCLAI